MTQEGGKALAWNHWRLLRRSVTQDFKEFALLLLEGHLPGIFADYLVRSFLSPTH